MWRWRQRCQGSFIDSRYFKLGVLLRFRLNPRKFNPRKTHFDGFWSQLLPVVDSYFQYQDVPNSPMNPLKLLPKIFPPTQKLGSWFSIGWFWSLWMIWGSFWMIFKAYFNQLWRFEWNSSEYNISKLPGVNLFIKIVNIFLLDNIFRSFLKATVMLETLLCWWLKVGDNLRKLATELRSWWHLLKVGARR